MLDVTSFKPQSVALDTSDDTDDTESGSESSGRNAFGNAGSVLTSDDALASTEQPIVTVKETTATTKIKTKKLIPSKRTTVRKTTTTEEPDYTDADDETVTTSAPRPKGAALLSENSAADLPRIQLIRAQGSGMNSMWNHVTMHTSFLS